MAKGKRIGVPKEKKVRQGGSRRDLGARGVSQSERRGTHEVESWHNACRHRDLISFLFPFISFFFWLLFSFLFLWLSIFTFLFFCIAQCHKTEWGGCVIMHDSRYFGVPKLRKWFCNQRIHSSALSLKCCLVVFLEHFGNVRNIKRCKTCVSGLNALFQDTEVVNMVP
jgi:hypothetical protein